MKVLENSVVDLDVLPGKEQQELKAQIQAQGGNVGYSNPYFTNQPTSANALSSDQLKNATDNLPAEQKEQADGVVSGVTNVASGVAGTAGGAVKGVLDTAGNTVRPPGI